MEEGSTATLILCPFCSEKLVGGSGQTHCHHCSKELPREIRDVLKGRIANRQPQSGQQERGVRATSQPVQNTRFAFAERAYGGLPTIGGIFGAFVGALIGFLLRPAAPIVGQLPLDAVLTRGANYRGLDQLLVSSAETSFNYLVVGLIVGGLGGALAAYLISGGNQGSTSESAKAIPPSMPKTVELGWSLEQVEDALGQPQKRINLGSKVIYVHNDLKVTFIEGKVDDVQ